MYLNNATWLSLVRYGVTLKTFPILPCPACSKVALRLLDKSFQQRKQSKQFDVSNIKGPAPSAGFVEALACLAEGYVQVMSTRFKFVAFLGCSECGEPVSVMGHAKSAPGTQESPPQLSSAGFLPGLQIFELKPSYPPSVRVELAKSFSAFFGDPTAAGSRVRTCVEFLLDEQGVQQFRLDRAGKALLSKDGSTLKFGLGERLKQFSEASPELGRMLGAVKHLGNEATHGPELPHDDLLEAYGLLEHVLEELYVTKPQRAKLLEQSNKMTAKFR